MGLSFEIVDLSHCFQKYRSATEKEKNKVKDLKTKLANEFGEDSNSIKSYREEFMASLSEVAADATHDNASSQN